MTMPDQQRLSLPFNLVKRHLKVVEQQIAEQARSFDPEVEEYVAYALDSRGKRLRPALVLLSAGATGETSAGHINLAVIVELIHLATLIHDDIIDEAVIRRDQPTPNAKWGNATSVLLGDCLFAHALKLSTTFEEPQIARRIAEATSDVCTGEIIQTKRRRDWNIGREDYLRIIEMKTASLFVIASELAARLNKAEDGVVETCAEYGRKLGIAYQIYDDCLDMAGSEDKAGKTLRTDLFKGKITLPLLNLLEESNDIEHAEICAMLEDSTEESVARLVRMTLERGHVHAAAEEAVNLVRDAQQKLSVLPQTEYTDAMRAVGDTLLNMLARLLPGDS